MNYGKHYQLPFIGQIVAIIEYGPSIGLHTSVSLNNFGKYIITSILLIYILWLCEVHVVCYKVSGYKNSDVTVANV